MPAPAGRAPRTPNGVRKSESTAMNLADQGYFWVGTEHKPMPYGTIISGQMYVQYLVPAHVRHQYPVVLVHAQVVRGRGIEHGREAGLGDDAGRALAAGEFGRERRIGVQGPGEVRAGGIEIVSLGLRRNPVARRGGRGLESVER